MEIECVKRVTEIVRINQAGKELSIYQVEQIDPRDGSVVWVGFDEQSSVNGVPVLGVTNLFEDAERVSRWAAYHLLRKAGKVEAHDIRNDGWPVHNSEFINLAAYLAAAVTGMYPLFGLTVHISI